MPPKNRKKKPQSNPARGFATTSVPSKVKPEAEKEEETEAVQVEPANEAPGTEKDNEKPPQDELNYEDHKLRELVEKYGPKVKKEATRYVEKLQAEKRLFRTSSSSAATQAMYPIYVEGAFGLHKEDRKSALRQNKDGSSTLGIADKIFNLAKEEAEAAWSSKKKRKIPGNYFGKVGETELIQSWMLYKTLISLGFQKAQVEKAIEDVVGYERVGVVSGKYNDSILGGIEPTGDLSNSLLREVLDYLVLMEADEQDLPPYVGKTGGEKKEDNVVEEPEVASETPPNNQRANRGPVNSGPRVLYSNNPSEGLSPGQTLANKPSPRELPPQQTSRSAIPAPPAPSSNVSQWPSLSQSRTALEPKDLEELTASLQISEPAGAAPLDSYGEPEKEEEEDDFINDIDDGLEPEQILPTWIKLRRRLYILDPSSVNQGGGRKKKGPPGPSGGGQDFAKKAKIQQLRDIIMKLERDQLFDQRTAGTMWSEEKVKIDKEKAGTKGSGGKKNGGTKSGSTGGGDENGRGGEGSRKKRGGMWWVDREDLAANASETAKEAEKPPLPPVEASNGLGDGEDMEDIIGGLFEAAPTEEQETTGERITVSIRNFEEGLSGTGTPGAKPKPTKAGVKQQQGGFNLAASAVRKVLEESVKARDVNGKVIYSPLGGTTYSYRQCLTIRWSPKSTVPPGIFNFANASAASFPVSIAADLGLIVTSSSSLTKIEMKSLATPTSLQAEAYVSLFALYVLTGGASGRGQVRIPGVWREVWVEFVEKEKLAEENLEKESLRGVKQLIFSNQEEPEVEGTNGDSTSNNGKSKLRKEGEADGGESSGGRNGKADWENKAEGEILREQWKQRQQGHKYLEMLEYRKNLPMWAFKEQVLSAIDQEQVVIVCGETGCGKSTQVPAFILEEELSNGRPCRVYCTEPRRISAISLARRVSEELGESKNELGSRTSIVGYAIRLESCVGPSTRLVYATTGIVMRMLERAPELEDITHLVLDEVHERSIDSDFLLIVLKKLLVKRKNLKVVLMSATVDAEKFSKYLNNAPVLTVPGRTFPVKVQYLEDAVELTKYRAEEPDPLKRGRGRTAIEDWEEPDDGGYDGPAKPVENISTTLAGYSKETKVALSKIDLYQIPYDLVMKLIEAVATHSDYAEYSKAILVFLPGIAEIRRLNDHLLGHPMFGGGISSRGNNKRQWVIYPLHSSIASEEQEAAFLIPSPGVRKIVLATNIAETGITIPDVTCVVDTGKHKEMRFDERRQLSRLIETFISRANAKQRRGRAGRVQNGLCFHLFTKDMHDTKMNDDQLPEMTRLSLQDLVLRVKICNMGVVEETLTLALDPPSAKNIRRAVDSLVEVKALTSTEELTPLGRQLAKLPLDVYLGKLVLLGSIYKCLDAAITIAAMLSSKSPFAAPMGYRKEADAARLQFKTGDSDLLTNYAAYCSWRRVCQGSNMSEWEFCRKNYLSAKTLSSIEDLKGQLIVAVVDAGYLTLTPQERADLNRARFQYRRKYFFTLPEHITTHSTNENLLNSITAAAFYPKLLARDGRGWRNVSNNQTIKLHSSSVNRDGCSAQWLTYYNIMSTSSKWYDAHETSYADDVAVALLCGESEWKMYAGVQTVDGHRVKFAYGGWKSLLAVKILRGRIRGVTNAALGSVGRAEGGGGGGGGSGSGNGESGGVGNGAAEKWMEIWREVVMSRKRLGEKKGS